VNWDYLAPARRYHEASKHSFLSVRTSAHLLDWDNRPNPFKEYAGLQPIPIPGTLARLLRWGAGVVRTRTLPGGEVYHFRTYASAGALYPIEVYVVTPSGVFHFHPGELTLRQLRRGDYRSLLGAPDAAAVLVLTGILWRTAWKYGGRGYRHLFWDAGTMLANLLALAASEEPRLRTGFLDERVNLLVGADGRREAALAMLALGRAAHAEEGEIPAPLMAEAEPISRTESPYPEAEALHVASSLTSEEDIRRYRDASPAATTGALAVDVAAGEPLETVIRRRGSARDFTSDSVHSSRLASILAAASLPLPADVRVPEATFVIANAVEGVEAGAHRFRPPDRFQPLKLGSFRASAGYLALEQEHAARAAATLFLTADLENALEKLGNRGYRTAQLEAGIRAGRLYLGAYARGLGATGLTFYDDDVSRFFATEKSPMLCVALGPTA
jgi:SagB-type dehydrogenase family enzyme